LDQQSRPAIDLGDDLTEVRAGAQTFAVDLVTWMRWLARAEGNLYDLIDQCKAKAAEEHGVQLSDTHARRFLDMLADEAQQKKS
jgi:hypothetical protein